MPKGKNQKFKLYRLAQIMLENTDEEHYITTVSYTHLDVYKRQKDIRWKTVTEYGEIDISINQSKPEKDPKAIAAARNQPASDYPRCICLLYT